MPVTYGNDLSLSPLFAKLGHSLEEIRVRALQNILSKLEHSLVCDADLVQEKHLHIRLLEWFNFATCPMQPQVLGLVLRMAKHASAARIYLNIGAVEFLTQLRTNADQSLYPLIDEILDQLFHLPMIGQHRHANECIYKHPEQDGEPLPSQFLEPSDLSLQTTDLAANPPAPGAPQYVSPPETQVGYFSTRPGTQDDMKTSMYTTQAATIPAAVANCFRFSTFPWVVLTPTDRHVLLSTDTSLKSSEVSLVTSACDFLSDVVLQDFPAEVFLQRPIIVKSLLSLLSVSPGTEGRSVALHAVKTLQDLAICLEARIYFYHDAAFYTPKQEFTASNSSTSSSASFLSHSLGSSDTRPSIIGRSDTRHRGDGQDGDNSSSSDLQPGGEADQEEMDIEDVQSLQFMQWSTPQFCVALLERLLPAMKTSDETLIMHGLELLQQVAVLLHESVIADALWDDGSVPARELTQKFSGCFEMLGDLLYLHYHGNLSKTIPNASLGQHRVAFTGIALYVVQLLQTVVPVEKASEALAGEFKAVLALISQDEILAQSFPAVRATALSYLEKIDAEGFNTYTEARYVCLSLENTCAFLSDVDEMSDENMFSLLTQAEMGVQSLPYHVSLQLVEGCVRLTSYICKKSSPNPSAMKQGRQLLLSLLAHPMDVVRCHAYTVTLNIVKEALNVNQVTQPTSSMSQTAAFLLDSHVLYEVACFGLSDSLEKVQQQADAILVYLLQCQLLVPATRWQQLLEAISPVLPVLQGYAAQDTTLGKCILGLLDTEPHIETGTLPLLERFRGTLRLMLNPETRVRSEGVGRLAWFLAHETESARKFPSFSELDVTNLTHLLIVDSPKALADKERGRSVFQTSDVKKVYEIFTSQTVEENVRKSAAERLAVMLEDPDLHQFFTELGGLDKVLSLLQLGVRRPTQCDGTMKKEVPVSLLPGMVGMLRTLIQPSASLRHTLAHESYLYYVLVRCALLHQTDAECCHQVAACLGFLLFDEVASLEHWSEEGANEQLLEFSLPNFVANRFRLPFKPPLHHARSPNMGVMPPNPDPLTSGTLAEMLRVTWNTAWNGGIEDLIKNSDCDKVADEQLFSVQLRLTAMDKRVLRVGYIPHVLQQCVYNVENATSHAMVTTAVLRLSSHLVACARYLDDSAVQSLGWTDVLTRFLLTVPSSNADEQLLAQILHMISLILTAPSRPSQDLLDWISEMLYHPKSAILGLVARPDAPGEEAIETTLHIRRQLNRQLLKFVHKFVGKFPYKLVERLTSKCVNGDLSRNLLTGINRKDAAHFYNLVSLESTLLCLMHVTSRPGWSVGCPDSDSLSVCLQALHSLLEVVSAFHIGRGGMSMSYMGRGVTRSATLCLRHLACEMATQLRSPDWPRNWLFSRQATPDSVGESGLHWLIPLWTYRDTEVRAAGFGIAVALTTTESGRITMMTQCQHIPGGIWGAAFSVLLDQAECSIVRRQAALLLVNLTSQPMPSGSVETMTNVWQGPVVRNEETQVSLVGLSALLALLHHSQFYPEMMVLLGNYYPQPAVHTVSVAPASVHTTPLGSRTTITTSGSGSLTTSSTFTEVSTPAYQRRPSIVGQNGDMTLTHTMTPVNISSQPLLGSLTSQSPVGTGPAVASSQPLANTVTTATSTPASLLGGAVRDTSTPTSVGEGSYPDYHSVATPCLVSGVCQLLSNIVTLAPQDTLICVNRENLHKVLISMEDSSILCAYLKELQSSPETRQRNLVAFDELLEMHCQVLRLLRLFAVQDADIRSQLLGDKATLRSLVQMLAVVYQDDADTAALCQALWESVFSLFLAILQTDGQVALREFTPVFVKHWSVIGGRAVSILQDTKECDTPLGVTVLQFLAVLLTEEARWRMKVAEGQEQDDCGTISLRLDFRSNSEESDLFQLTSGHQLCQVLVKVYDSVALKPHDQFHLLKVTVINAFKALLAVSVSAKMAALEGGVVESICEHVRHLLRKIKLQALELGLTDGATSKMAAARKKENPIISELIVTFELLRSFMYHQTEVKVAAYESGLGNIVHSLWVWCLLDPALMTSVLALLTTFTARCPQAASSLVFTSAQSLEIDRPNDALLLTTTSGVKGQHSNNSLVHCLVKLLRKTTQNAVLRAGFSLMCTLALSQECRGVLWKCNFLNEFSSLMPKKTKKTSLMRLKETVWLDLLASLSFSTDGQNMILKVNDAVSLLLEFGSGGSEHNQKSAVLVLRNLCFNTAAKSQFLATAKLLPFLLRCVEQGSEQVRVISCSALWALVYNSHKAKVNLKNAHVMGKLQEAYSQLVNMPDSPWAEKCAQNLHDVLVVLRS